MGQVFYNKHELEIGHIIEDMVYIVSGSDEEIEEEMEVIDFFPGGFKTKTLNSGNYATYKFERVEEIKFREGDK